MSVKFEKQENGLGELSFTIEQEKVEPALDAAFKRVQKTLNVPGFRKGKLPRKIFNNMYGEEALYEEALNTLIGPAYMTALEQVDEDIVGQPEFVPADLGSNQDWRITAIVQLKPEVTLGDYKNLDVTKQDREVSDEDVEASLEADRHELAELAVKEDAAEEGDTVVIDFLGKQDGEPFEGGEAKNYSLKLGSNSFIPGFEEQLVGSKAGEEVEVELSFPEDYQAEELAGQEVVFEVTVHEVKAEQLPELDDDFAQDIDEEVETIAELREKRKAELEAAKDAQATDAVEDEAIRKAVENAEITAIPYDMAHEEVHRQMDIYLNNLQSQGISPEMYFQLTGTSEADLHKQMEAGAEERVKTNLVLEAIVAAEELSATEEEKDVEVQNLAKDYNLEEDAVREALNDEMLTHDITLKKAIDLIVDSANEVLEAETAE